jgi:hypothetical protein
VSVKWIILALTFMIGVVAMQFISIFVVQPIGAIPNGVTVIITRPVGFNFIDTPDAVCERRTGSVTLLCRGMVGAQVARQEQILLRLPYSSTLYSWSTGGKTYDR